MPSMRITCPESAHLEQIDFELTPLGLLIRQCSAFAAGCVACPRTCAARLDRRLSNRDDQQRGLALLTRSCMT